eukprot:TRINITY_DN26339_c0_g1_i1.p1 TRINITY_DN26339_c0_g1~~TRINITY_DN26339_c0_g1_i1.p1  ORF type:complete len:650 (-),score=83.22 TRINITY_DN26339_c0_g1_i1:1318-3267(-)
MYNDDGFGVSTCPDSFSWLPLCELMLRLTEAPSGLWLWAAVPAGLTGCALLYSYPPFWKPQYLTGTASNTRKPRKFNSAEFFDCFSRHMHLPQSLTWSTRTAREPGNPNFTSTRLANYLPGVKFSFMSFSDYFSGFQSWLGGSSGPPSVRPVVRQFSALDGAPLARDSRASIDKSVVKLRGFHGLAKDCIAAAIRKDEAGLSQDAANLYEKAIEVIGEGLSVPLPSRPDVNKLRQDLEKWQRSVLERMDMLAEHAHTAPQIGRTSSGNFYFGSDNSAPQPPLRRQNTQPLGPRTTLSSSSSSSRSPTTAVPSSTSSPSSRARERKAAPGGSGRRAADESNNAGDGGQAANALLKGVDPQMLEAIQNEIVDQSPGVKWDDIAGLVSAKQALQEMVILPTLRADLFQGLRKPARGLLLYGPPGNGKTMLAKAVATESSATFFNVSASTLTSKWVGEGEKLMKALFAVAAAKQPSVIFIDEIDSILSARTANEHDASRRLKTEFLVQFDGVPSVNSDRVIVMGATNRPQELDEAARRRFVKRIFIPLPDAAARKSLFQHLLKGQDVDLSNYDFDEIVAQTEGYSASDLKALCQEAAMLPIRELGARIRNIRANQVRKLNLEDLEKSLSVIRASVSTTQLKEFDDWSRQFGSV